MEDEPIVRFATESGQITASRVKMKLFKPNRQLLLSVFRVKDLRYSEIRDIGVNDVVRKHPTARRLYGWGRLSTSVVREVGLRIDNDDDPSRHSEIKGWPEDVQDRRLLQIKLADRAQPVKLDAPAEVK